MGVTATVSLLFSAVTKAQAFVYVFTTVYTLVIFAYILSSWLRLPYSPWLNRIQRFLYDVSRAVSAAVPTRAPLDGAARSFADGRGHRAVGARARS